MDLVTAYRSIRERLLDLGEDLSDDDISTTVIPTPDWTVKDTYAHLVGAIDDMLSGTLDGYGSDAWTAVHVTARSSHSLEQLCDEWRGLASDFETFLESTGDENVGIVAGSWTHEQDIRGSLGLKGVGDTGGMDATLELLHRFGRSVDDAGLPGLRVVTDNRTWELGASDVGATLTVTPYVAARLVFGRRSPSQVLAMDWQGDPSPYLDILGVYGLAAADIID